MANDYFRIGSGEEWLFQNGQWEDGSDNELKTPAVKDENIDEPWLDVHKAFYMEKAYGDFDAEFEFCRYSGHCGVGLIFRAQDPGCYYTFKFPFCGQQAREGHFWAVVIRTDKNGWEKVLLCTRVPGIPCEAGIWNKARIIVSGNGICTWVNGRPLPQITDQTYPSGGHIGTIEWGGCSIRGLSVCGKETRPYKWERNEPHVNWFYPLPEKICSEIPERQVITGMVRTFDGDLLMTVNDMVMRSTDNGLTWDRAGSCPAIQNGTIAALKNGNLFILDIDIMRPFMISIARSEDNGRTWSGYKQVGRLALPEVIKESYMYGQILELKDGGLIYFGMTYPPENNFLVKNGRRYRGPQVPGMMNFCIRSDDGGETWSEPVDIDGCNPMPAQWMSFKDGCSEITATELQDGEIVAFVRPGSAWAVWETRSADGGRTWTPMTAGPFLCYASASPLRATASGAIVIGGRFPGLAVYISRDNGMTWETYQIDTESWAMGAMCEVAPDVVLWIYGSCSKRLRGQYIKIDPAVQDPCK